VITIRLFRGPDIGETVKAQVRGMPVFSMAQVRKMDARGRKIGGEAFGEFVVRERIRV